MQLNLFLNRNIFTDIFECTVWCIIRIIMFVALKWSWKSLNGSIELYQAPITHSLIFVAPVSGALGYNAAPLCDENSTWIEPDIKLQCKGHALRCSLTNITYDTFNIAGLRKVEWSSGSSRPWSWAKEGGRFCITCPDYRLFFLLSFLFFFFFFFLGGGGGGGSLDPPLWNHRRTEKKDSKDLNVVYHRSQFLEVTWLYIISFFVPFDSYNFVPFW